MTVTAQNLDDMLVLYTPSRYEVRGDIPAHDISDIVKNPEGFTCYLNWRIVDRETGATHTAFGGGAAKHIAHYVCEMLNDQTESRKVFKPSLSDLVTDSEMQESFTALYNAQQPLQKYLEENPETENDSPWFRAQRKQALEALELIQEAFADPKNRGSVRLAYFTVPKTLIDLDLSQDSKGNIVFT